MNNSANENARTAKKPKKGFRILLIVYFLFIVALIVASIFILNRVTENVAECNRSQPELCIEAKVAEIKSRIDDGSIGSYIDIASLYPRHYGAPVERFVTDYVALLQKREITYVPLKSSEEREKQYAIKAGDDTFATVALESRNERTTLFSFGMADWSVKKITPIRFNCHNVISVLIPAGYRCYINDVQVTGKPEDAVDGVPKYTVSDLPENVNVRFENAEGKELSYVSAGEGLLSPVAYRYMVSLPRDITIIVDGKALDKPAAVEGKCTYEISGMTEPTMVLRDIFGNERPYDGQSTTALNTFSVEIPENFSLSTVTGVFYAPEDASRADDPYLSEMQKYLPDFRLNDLLTYHLSSFTKEVKVVVTDNLGGKQMYTLEPGRTLSIRSQRGQDEMPAELLAEIDPMKFAVDWSKFMTNDEKFDNIKKYFLKDSTFYKEAYTWAHDPDHKFTSGHEAPTFSNKKTREFVQYTDNCFSVRVSLTKSMFLPNGRKTVTDDLDMIVYFVKYDTTPDNGKDDPVWIVAVKYDAVWD